MKKPKMLFSRGKRSEIYRRSTSICKGSKI